MTARHSLDQIERGLDGVTPGSWVVRETTLHGIGYGGHWLEVSDEDQDICISGSGGAKSYTQRVVDTQQHDDNEANLRHFANCSPDAMREIAAYVRETEARATAAEATVTALREALEKAEEVQKRGKFQAMFLKGTPADCCDYGVVSVETRKEICRVWKEDDARLIERLLNEGSE